jgi:hypothetical protein
VPESPEEGERVPGSPEESEQVPESPEEGERVPESPAEPGRVRIRVSAAGGGQRLCPEFGEFAAYSLNGSSAAGETLPEQIVSEDSAAEGLLSAIDLKAGTWTITVNGLIDPENSSSPFAAVRGSVKVTLKSGITTEAAVTLDQTIPESEIPGFITYDVEFPQDQVNSAILTFLFDNDSEEPDTAAAVDLKAGTKSGKIALRSGYYRMKLSLIGNFSHAEETESFCIYPGMVTPLPRYTFSTEDFPRTAIFSTTEALKNYLSGMDPNSPENPYPVAMRGLDLSAEGTLKTLFKALERYVDLDLGACSGTEISASSTSIYIVSLELPETVTRLDEGAFKGYIELVSIKMPKVNKIGKAAFSGCVNLKSIYMPEVDAIEDGKEGDTSTGVFYNCAALGSVDLPLVQELGIYAFYKCTSLVLISLPLVETVGRSAFRSCDNLKAVKLPVVNTIGNNAFYDDPALDCLILGKTPPILAKTVFNANSPKKGIYVPAEAVETFKSSWTTKKIESLADLPEEYKTL